MERELWTMVVMTDRMVQGRESRRFISALGEIARVFLWAALPDRPVSWACGPQH